MRHNSGNICSYAGLVVVGVGLLAGACSSGVTAPSRALPVTASQGTPLTVGALTISGVSTIVDTVLQVSVTIKNDSTAPVSFGYGACNGLSITLYRTATHADRPVWQAPGTSHVMCAVMTTEHVEPGQARTFTNVIPLSWLMHDLGADAAGTYYVTASIDRWTVDAGAVTIP